MIVDILRIMGRGFYGIFLILVLSFPSYYIANAERTNPLNLDQQTTLVNQDDRALSGTYTINIIYSGTNDHTFTVSKQSIDGGTTLNVRTDQLYYEVGDTVLISGKISPVLMSKSVGIQIWSPEGRLYKAATAPLDIDGNFHYSFQIMESKITVSGPYRIQVEYIRNSATTTYIIQEVRANVQDDAEKSRSTDQDVKLTLKIIDEESDLAVTGGLVTIANESGKIIDLQIVDSNGEVSIKLPKGEYKCIVQVAEYHKRTEIIRIQDDMLITIALTILR